MSSSTKQAKAAKPRKSPTAARSVRAPNPMVETLNPRTPIAFTDLNKGLLQQKIKELITTLKRRRLSDADMDLVGAIINPGHQMNIVNAQPIPDAGPNKVFILKTMWREEIKIGAVSSVCFYTGPSFEAPFMYWDGAKMNIFQIGPCRSSTGGTAPTVAPYLSNHHVYAYRPIGKSMTIENTTAAINRAGAVCTGRKTMDVDYLNRQFATGAIADAVNQPILQRVPLTAAEVTSLPSGSTEWSAAEGAYVVAHHNGNYNWVYRTDATQKCFPAGDAGTGNNNCSLKYTDQSTGTVAQVWNYDHPTFNAQSGPCDGMDMGVACFTGLVPSETTFTVKCCVAYEFWLKASSDFNPFVVSRHTDLELLEAVMEFESSEFFNAGAFPADYNFWDKVWKAFKNIWNAGGGNLAQAGLNALAPGAGNASKFVGDYLTSQY